VVVATLSCSVLVVANSLESRVQRRACIAHARSHTDAFSCMQVLEIRPSIKWDKGKALEFLLKSLGQLPAN